MACVPAVEMGQRALTNASELADLALDALARLQLGRAFHELGDYRKAMGFLRPNVTTFSGGRAHERLGQPILLSLNSRQWLAWCHGWRGEFAEAQALAGECRDIVGDADQAADLITTSGTLGLPALLRGDLILAVPALERAISLARTRSIKSWIPASASFLGYAYCLAGRPTEGVVLLEEGLEIAGSVKHWPCVSLWTGWLAEAHLLQGRTADATWQAERSLQLAIERKEGGYQAFSLRLVGELAARRERSESAKGGRASPPGNGDGRGARDAAAGRAVSSQSRAASSAHRQAGPDAVASHHRGVDVPRHGDALLAGTGAGGDGRGGLLK
jgi:hypothetical protein